MTTSSPAQPSTQLPIHRYIKEINTLMDFTDDPRFSDMLSGAKTTLDSLQTLNQLVEQLPSLTEGHWFLRSQYMAARDQIVAQLNVVKDNLSAMCVDDSIKDDPFNLIFFCVEFINFTVNAKNNLALLQQPYELTCPLRMPDSTPSGHDDPVDELLANYFYTINPEVD